MKVVLLPKVTLFIFLISMTSAVLAEDSRENVWTVRDPILSSGLTGTFNEIAVKDPSIVFFEGEWHLFFTARNEVWVDFECCY